MAIGHIDVLRWTDGTLAQEFLDDLENALHAAQPERSPSSVTSHANQIRRFVGISENDLVVTVNSSVLLVGRVVGPA